ncbi:MAG TPA: hypothetical protein VMZ52_01630 [Bryobacteraceae bacterium]|nr:hypothetical protein [Bryobacteraceae bacterium]
MKSRTRFWASLLGVVLASSAFAQSEPVITIDKVMTGEELRTTGIGSLTAAQRAALDHWLSAYTVQVLQYTQASGKPAASTPGTYVGSGGGHWIKSKADNGGIISLEDGSMWAINSIDRIIRSSGCPLPI